MSFSDDDIFNRKFGSTLTLNLDGSATAMSLSPWGRDVVLAGRKGLYIIDLDNPFSPPRWLRHLTSFEVADVQWCPHSYHPDYIVSTSNQKAIVWNLSKPSSNAHELILYGGHERAISDLNFHNLNPNLLGTCSIDSTCNIWDLRNSQKPSLIVSDWGYSSTQIKFNHFNENIFASTHGNRLSIWDMRFLNNKPVSRIVAHDSKINGLNFSKNEEFELITCSNDKTIKSWDYNTMAQNYIIETDFPIKLARRVPFGDGIAILPVRGSNAAFVMETPKHTLMNKLNPIHVFDGNIHNIKKPMSEILWLNNSDTNQYQLISWSEDKILQRWSPCDELLQKFNCKTIKSPTIPNKADHKKMVHKSLSDKDFRYVTFRNEPKVMLNQQTNLGISTILTSDVNWTNQSSSGSTNDHLSWILNVKSADNDPYNLAHELQQNNEFIRQYNINLDEINIAKGLLNFSLFSPILDIDLKELIITPDTKFLDELTTYSKRKTNNSHTNNHNSVIESQHNKNGNSDSVQNENKKNGDQENFDSDVRTNNNNDSNEHNDAGKDSKNLSSSSNALQDEDEEDDYVFLTFKVKLPQNYPFKVCPEFTIETASNNSFSSSLRRKLLDKKDGEEHIIIKCLRYIASTCTNVDRYCLDYVFQFLSGIQIDLTEFITIDEEDNKIESMNKKSMSTQDIKNFIIDDDGSIQVGIDNNNLYEVNNRGSVIDNGSTIGTSTDEDENEDEDEDYLVEGENIATFMDGNFMSKDEYNNSNMVDVSRNNKGIENTNISTNNLKYLNNTPPEIRCGARWAPNGELIYFNNCGVRYNECYFKSWITIKNGETNQYYNLKMIKDDGNEGRKHSMSDDNASTVDIGYDESADINPHDNHNHMNHDDYNEIQHDNELEEDDIFDNDDDTNKFAFNVTSKLDFTSILPSKIDLGKCYEITIGRKDIFNIAEHNAKISRSLLLDENYFNNDMVDINHCWNIVKIMLLDSELLSDVENLRLNRGIENHDFRLDNRWSKTFNGLNEYDWGLALHNFGSNGLIKDMFDYFEYKHDIQMLAMLSCVLIEKGKLTNYFYTNSNFIEKNDEVLVSSTSSTRDDKYAHTPDTLDDNRLFLTQYEVRNYPEVSLNIEIDPFGNMKEDYSLMNDRSFRNRLNKYRDIYSNMLLAWNLPLKRVEILKYNYKYDNAEFYTHLNGGNKSKDSSYSFLEVKYSKECKVLKCCYCYTNLTKEKISLCNNCHHVLHSKCSKEWFGEVDLEANDTECPSGCGCKCTKHL